MPQPRANETEEGFTPEPQKTRSRQKTEKKENDAISVLLGLVVCFAFSVALG
jgi:hypothetical protein